MLQDIAIEEFSHLEMVANLIAQHTSDLDQTSARRSVAQAQRRWPALPGQPRQLLDSSLHQEGGNVVNADNEDQNTRKAGTKRAGGRAALPPSRPPEAA